MRKSARRMDLSPQKTMWVWGMKGKWRASQWNFHGGGGDEDLVVLLEGGEDAGSVGHDVEIGEEVFGVEVVVEDGLVVGRDDLPEALAE